MFPNTELKEAERIEEIHERTEVYEVSAYTIAADETGNGTGVTASGVVATPYHTAACNDLPFGTLIEIDGHIWTVEDRMRRDGCIDLCMDTKDACFQFGRKVMGVRIIE